VLPTIGIAGFERGTMVFLPNIMSVHGGPRSVGGYGIFWCFRYIYVCPKSNARYVFAIFGIDRIGHWMGFFRKRKMVAMAAFYHIARLRIVE
jgi:hypothetical protein